MKCVYIISPELANFLGSENIIASRVEIVHGICMYIADHHLQNPNNHREIRLDKTLQLLFNLDAETKTVSYSEISSLIQPHIYTNPPPYYTSTFKTRTRRGWNVETHIEIKPTKFAYGLAQRFKRFRRTSLLI